MRTWRIVSFWAILFCNGCNYPESKLSSQFKRDDTDSYIVLERPHAYQVHFKPGALERKFALLVPYVSTSGDSLPSVAFKRIAQTIDDTSSMNVRATWFEIHLWNMTAFENWAIVIDNPGLKPKIYAWNGKTDSLIGEFEGETQIGGYFHKPVKELFSFVMNSNDDIKLLVKLSSNESVAATNIYFYPYAYSKYEPVTATNKGLRVGVVGIVLTLITLSMFMFTKDWAWFVFLLYLSLTICPLILFSDPFFLGNHTLLANVISIASEVSFVWLFYKLAFARMPRNRSFFSIVSAILILLLVSLLDLEFSVGLGSSVQLSVEFIIDVLLLGSIFIFRNECANARVSILLSVSVFLDVIYTMMLGSYTEIAFVIYTGITILMLAIFLFLLFDRFRQTLLIRRRKSEETKLAEQRVVSSAVINSLEQERKRIAQDIHDELGSTLALIKIKLASDNNDSKDATELRSLISRASSSARSIAYQLMPPYFAETDLKMLLFSHFNTLNERGDIKFDFNYSNGHNAFTKDEELMIYRIVLELTNNCIKHSGATHATVFLAFGEKELVIEFTDNGKGIGESVSSGIGMQSIQSRVSYLNGTIERESTHPGCRFMIRIPYREQA